MTILILITAFASVYTGLLGASRLPFNAARDGMFFRPFGKLHQRLRFPHISLLVMGAVTAIATIFTLTTISEMCTHAFTGCPARSGSNPAATSRRMR